MSMKKLTLILSLLLAVLLSATAVVDLAAQNRMPFRAGVQVGLSAERSRYSWPDGADATATADVDARQNGFIGAVFEFPLSTALSLEFGPRYGQRNVPIVTMQRRGCVQFSIRQDPVEYLSVPVLARLLFVRDGLVRPYAGAGMAFGMNLSSLSVTIEELRFSEEPPSSSIRTTRRNINQLFGAVLAEAGLDFRTSERWSVLLGVGYSKEWTPLIDDPMLSWEAPHSWNVRFVLLHLFGGGS